jgi:hypothetical protein
VFDTSCPRHFGQLVGVELLPALVFGALAVAFAARGSKLQRAIGWSMGVWFVLGAVVASFMGRQWPTANWHACHTATRSGAPTSA